MQFNNGEHGFHNDVMDMKTIFRAVGPNFQQGLEVEPFESIHVYELMCRLLDIVPEPNDGALATLLPTLRSGEPPRAAGGRGSFLGLLAAPTLGRSSRAVWLSRWRRQLRGG